MNVLYMVPAMFPYGWAYAARARNLAHMMVEAGMNVTVMSDYLSDGVAWSGNNLAYDGNVKIVTTSNIKSSERTIVDKLLIPHRTNKALKKFLKTNHVDYIVCNQNTTKFNQTWKMSRKLQIPLILEVCEWYSHKNWKLGYFDPRYLSFLYCWYFKFPKVKKVICISRLLEQYFKKKGADVLRIPTILDVLAKPVKDTNEQHFPIRLVFVGGITGGKDELVEVIKCICSKDLPIDIYIYGPDKKSIINLLSNFNYDRNIFDQKIHIFGYIDQREIEQILVECDYGILFRPNRRSSNAGFPTKLGEYFAAGLPVLANDTGDIGLFLHDKINGVLAKSNRFQDVSDALDRLITIKDLEYRTLSRSARKTAELYFDYRKYIEDFTQFITTDE